MPFSIALMIVVDTISRKWMDDRNMPEPERARNCGAAQATVPIPAIANETALSRAPAERRLGDRALSAQWFGALALLDAEARRRAPQAILHGRARLRSGAGRLRVDAGEEQTARPAKPCSRRRDVDGKPIHGNSVLGHSLEGTPGPARRASSAAC